MKNSLLVPVVFISNLLVWLCLFSFFSQLCSYDSLRNLSSGIYMPFLRDLTARVLYLFPFALMCALLASYLFLMRHKSAVFVSVPLVLLLTVLSVLFAIPFSYRLSERFTLLLAASGTGSREGTSGVHAPGYIRSYDGNNRVIWYSIEGERVSPLVAARNAAGPEGNALEVYESARYAAQTGLLSTETAVFTENAGGRDPLLASSLQPPPYLDSAAADAVRVLDDLRTAWERDFFGYLIKAGSFFAAVTALWILAYATGWRLLNMLLVVAGFRLLFAFYPLATEGRLFQLVRRLLPASVGSLYVSPLLYAALTVLVLVAGLGFLVKKLVSRSGREAFHD